MATRPYAKQLALHYYPTALWLGAPVLILIAVLTYVDIVQPRRHRARQNTTYLAIIAVVATILEFFVWFAWSSWSHWKCINSCGHKDDYHRLPKLEQLAMAPLATLRRSIKEEEEGLLDKIWPDNVEAVRGPDNVEAVRVRRVHKIRLACLRGFFLQHLTLIEPAEDGTLSQIWGYPTWAEHYWVYLVHILSLWLTVGTILQARRKHCKFAPGEESSDNNRLCELICVSGWCFASLLCFSIGCMPWAPGKDAKEEHQLRCMHLKSYYPEAYKIRQRATDESRHFLRSPRFDGVLGKTYCVGLVYIPSVVAVGILAIVCFCWRQGSWPGHLVIPKNPSQVSVVEGKWVSNDKDLWSSLFACLFNLIIMACALQYFVYYEIRRITMYCKFRRNLMSAYLQGAASLPFQQSTLIGEEHSRRLRPLCHRDGAPFIKDDFEVLIFSGAGHPEFWMHREQEILDFNLGRECIPLVDDMQEELSSGLKRDSVRIYYREAVLDVQSLRSLICYFSDWLQALYFVQVNDINLLLSSVEATIFALVFASVVSSLVVLFSFIWRVTVMRPLTICVFILLFLCCCGATVLLMNDMINISTCSQRDVAYLRRHVLCAFARSGPYARLDCVYDEVKRFKEQVDLICDHLEKHERPPRVCGFRVTSKVRTVIFGSLGAIVSGIITVFIKDALSIK